MKLSFTAARTPLAQEALKKLIALHGHFEPEAADVVVALGGDGLVLKTLYQAIQNDKPVFAMRRTEHVGFLCNEFNTDNLIDRINNTKKIALRPLQLEAQLANGQKEVARAINEVTVMRETPQSARLRIVVDGIERIARYSGDGILLSTPAGSTAYNHSCGGPIMPLNANTLVITAISGFRPRGWRYAVLPQDSIVEIEALEINKRPVRIEAGEQVIHNAVSVTIALDPVKSLTLLFDPEQHLGERIVREQFML